MDTTQAFILPNNVCELHDALGRSMRFCRWAGFLPVEGLGKKTITDIKFNIKSTYVLYHSTTLFFQMFLASLSLYYFFINNLQLDYLKNVLFYLTGLLTAILLLNLAKGWPKLIRKAADIESCVATVRTIKSRKYHKVASIVMMFALMEHVLSVLFKLKLVMSHNKENGFSPNVIKTYFIETAPQVFEIITYAEWKAVLFEIANLQATFLWNIIDAITMCFSLYLCSYFKDLNKLIEHQEKRKMVNWREMRIYYSYLVELVHAVDKNMCYLILLSFFTNVFFICVQLFYLTMLVNDIEYSLYYAYSFLFLFIRATITSVMAANVNSVAKRPLLVLETVESIEYTLDVQRFIRQIRYTTIALSGLYFHITRGMLLTVFGTVVKYELVMHQFSFKNYNENVKLN